MSLIPLVYRIIATGLRNTSVSEESIFLASISIVLYSVVLTSDFTVIVNLVNFFTFFVCPHWECCDLGD